MVYKVVHKDWERMQDLLDRDQNGEGVASKIKSKDKAVARYIAGMKLLKETAVEPYRENQYYLPYSCFKAFGQKALDLGATYEDLLETEAATEIPDDFFANHVTKDDYRGYTGSLRRLLDQLRALGVTIEMKSLNQGYNFWSWVTSEAYARNGRVWPLNYEINVEYRGETLHHTIIVVTNEGGGNYGYDFDRSRMPWGMIKARLEREVKDLVGLE